MISSHIIGGLINFGDLFFKNKYFELLSAVNCDHTSVSFLIHIPTINTPVPVLCITINTPLPKDGDEAAASFHVAADFCLQQQFFTSAKRR